MPTLLASRIRETDDLFHVTDDDSGSEENVERIANRDTSETVQKISLLLSELRHADPRRAQAARQELSTFSKEAEADFLTLKEELQQAKLLAEQQIQNFAVNPTTSGLPQEPPETVLEFILKWWSKSNPIRVEAVYKLILAKLGDDELDKRPVIVTLLWEVLTGNCRCYRGAIWTLLCIAEYNVKQTALVLQVISDDLMASDVPRYSVFSKQPGNAHFLQVFTEFLIHTACISEVHRNLVTEYVNHSRKHVSPEGRPVFEFVLAELTSPQRKEVLNELAALLSPEVRVDEGVRSAFLSLEVSPLGEYGFLQDTFRSLDESPLALRASILQSQIRELYGDFEKFLMRLSEQILEPGMPALREATWASLALAVYNPDSVGELLDSLFVRLYHGGKALSEGAQIARRAEALQVLELIARIFIRIAPTARKAVLKSILKQFIIPDSKYVEELIPIVLLVREEREELLSFLKAQLKDGALANLSNVCRLLTALGSLDSETAALLEDLIRNPKSKHPNELAEEICVTLCELQEFRIETISTLLWLSSIQSGTRRSTFRRIADTPLAAPPQYGDKPNTVLQFYISHAIRVSNTARTINHLARKHPDNFIATVGLLRECMQEISQLDEVTKVGLFVTLALLAEDYGKFCPQSDEHAETRGFMEEIQGELQILAFTNPQLLEKIMRQVSSPESDDN